jgi:hypothetical protein
MGHAAVTRFVRDEIPNVTKAIADAKVTLPGGESVPISAGLYINFEAGSTFIGFYIPAAPVPGTTYRVIEQLARDYKEIMAPLQAKFRVRRQANAAGGGGDALQFSGEVFLYHDDEMSLEQLSSLIALYESQGLSLRFKD